MRYLYTILMILLTPFIPLRLLWRSRKMPAYRGRWQERFGFIPTLPAGKNIWVHAVSLGEAIAVMPLIKALRQSHPENPVIITTMTPSGSHYVQQQLDSAMFHYYVPYDLPSCVKRFLSRTKPVLAVIMETELWPNLLHYTHRQNIPILLANARLSERSQQGYLKFRSLVSEMLGKISLIAAQSEKDAERFHALGANKKSIMVSGNIKFDAEIPLDLQQKGLALRAQWADRPCFIAASTHEGEEKVILAAFKKIRIRHPNILLILVPRHPERFQAVAELCRQHNLDFVRHSQAELPNKTTAIYLGDTIGQLKLLYAASDVAFVGGSLALIGGHNFIEAAMFRLPLISGPNLQNFVALRDLLLQAEALTIIKDAEELSQTVIDFFDDRALREKTGEQSYRVYISNKGALSQHLHWIQNRLLAA